MKKLIVAVVTIWVLVVAAAVGTGVVLLSSDDGEPAADPSSEPAEPTEAPSTDSDMGSLEDFYEQQIAWEDCGEWECGSLTVPVDYADPTGATIDLNLSRTSATGSDPVGSLVVNPGGPGAPGSDMVEGEQAASYYFQPELRDAFDIVGFDPRGTGESAPVDCLSDGDLDDYLARDSTPDDDGEVDEFVAEGRAFWEGCADNTGELLAHVSTIESARDMDVLRAALGEEQLHYLGFSYGTTLGATYAELFPDNVGRFVLDSAVNPQLDFIEDSLSQAEGFENALRNYVKACVDGSNCFLGSTVQEGLDTISGLLEEVDDQPLPTQGDRDLEVGYAETGIVAALYNDALWPALDAGITEALGGTGDTLLLLADQYASRLGPGGGYANNLMEAFPAISCLDQPESMGVDEVEEWFDDFEEVAPTMGESFAWGLTWCDGFPVESTEDPLEIRAEGAAPIIVVGVTGDPATPHDEAVALAEQLDSGVLLSVDANRHGGYTGDSPCAQETVHALLVDGEAPADTVTC